MKNSETTGLVSLLPLAKRMLSSASGPLVSFVVLLGLPLLGAWLLPAPQFAMWSILSTITTVALSLDFGGVALVVARHGSVPLSKLIFRGAALSSLGALVIGAVGAALWVPYSTTDAGAAFGLEEGLAAIALTTLAACIRGILIVVAQAALHERLLAIRNFATAGHAFACLVVAVPAIYFWRTAWALPVGWSLSGLVVLIVCLVWAKTVGMFKARQLRPKRVAPGSTSTFVWSRSAATVLNACMLQGDRWLIGALGGPELLAAYEVTWRIASLPRFLLANLAVVVGSQASALAHDDPPGVWSNLRQSTALLAVIGAAGLVGVGVLYLPVLQIIGQPPLLAFFISMLVAFSVVGLASPLSLTSIAVGLPALDLRYLLAACAAAAGFAALASWANDISFYVYGANATLALGVGWFFFYGSRDIKVRLGIARVSAPVQL